MIARPGDVLGWAGTALGVLCLLVVLVAWANRGDPGAALLAGMVGVGTFVLGRASRYVLRGIN